MRARKVGTLWLSYFRHRQHVMNTNRYTNAELVDIQFIYGLSHGNEYITVPQYREMHPKRWQPNDTFTRVHQNLGEHGSFTATIEGTERQRTARTHIRRGCVACCGLKS